MMMISRGAVIKTGTLASLTGDISLTDSFSVLKHHYFLLIKSGSLGSASHHCSGPEFCLSFLL